MHFCCMDRKADYIKYYHQCLEKKVNFIISIEFVVVAFCVIVRQFTMKLETVFVKHNASNTWLPIR